MTGATFIIIFAFALAFVKAHFSEELGQHDQEDVIEESSSISTKAGIADPGYRWLGKTIVYSIQPGFTFLSTFIRAMQHIRGRTCIRFKQRSNETDYVFVAHHPGRCFALTGRKGGRQDVAMSNGCAAFHTQLRYLVHTIGFFNEITRPDRDQFVTINEENIRNDSRSAFMKKPKNLVSYFGVSYDYRSIMHSPRNFFTANGKETITPLDPNVSIGGFVSLSRTDIRKINAMYCPGTQGIRFRSMADGKFLQVVNGSGPFWPLITSTWDVEDHQKFTTDWNTVKDRSEGSTIVPWIQGWSRLLVLSEGDSNAPLPWPVHSREYDGISSQTWWIRRKPYAKSSRWQIVSKKSGKCLESKGSSEAVMEHCDLNNAAQLWKVHIT